MIIPWDSRRKISSLIFKEQQRNDSIWILWFWTLPPSFLAFATCRTPPVETEVGGLWESVKLPIRRYAFKISNCPNFVSLGTREGKKKILWQLTITKESKKNFGDLGRTTAGSSDPPGVCGGNAPLLHSWRGRLRWAECCPRSGFPAGELIPHSPWARLPYSNLTSGNHSKRDRTEYTIKDMILFFESSTYWTFVPFQWN